MMNVRVGDQTEDGFGLVGVDRQGIGAELDHRDLLRASPAASEVEDRQVFTKSGPCQGTTSRGGNRGRRTLIQQRGPFGLHRHLTS
jgi:hypothetical protein